jgi:hypothetical protein
MHSLRSHLDCRYIAAPIRSRETAMFRASFFRAKFLRAKPSSLAIAALMALAVPSMALAQQPQKDEHKGPPPLHPSGGPPPLHPTGPPPPSGTPHFKPVLTPHLGPGGGPPPPPGPGGGPLHPPGFGGPSHLPGFGGPPPPGAVQFGYRGHYYNRLHLIPFIYPPGWAYRQWAIGAFLPSLFLTPDYYYPDWAALALEPPPPGTQWVRYGPDLLLVDVNTGEVIDVVYGAFYE